MSWEANYSGNHSASPSLWPHLETRTVTAVPFSCRDKRSCISSHKLLSSRLTVLFARSQRSRCFSGFCDPVFCQHSAAALVAFFFFGDCFFLSCTSGFDHTLAVNFFPMENVRKTRVSLLPDPCMPLDQCAKHVCASLLCFPTTSTWT